MAEDDFSQSVNSVNAFAPEKDLPGSYPASAGQAAAAKDKFTCKYASFAVDADGNEKLEQIMNDCLAGKKILVQEKWTSTKEGDTIVTVKYFIPDAAPKNPDGLKEIKGARRLAKAMRGKD
jgi:hypothetical protein